MAAGGIGGFTGGDRREREELAVGQGALVVLQEERQEVEGQEEWLVELQAERPEVVLQGEHPLLSQK